MALENEKKYKITNLQEQSVSKYYKHKKIVQVYLDLDNINLRQYLLKLWGSTLLMLTKEARVRFIDETKAVLTIKTEGGMARMEHEQELNMVEAVSLKDAYGKSFVSKHRYRIPTCPKINDVELDFYTDRDLVVAELEFDPDKLKPMQVDMVVGSVIEFIDKNAKVLDVTEDKAYKNVNLALPFEGENENE